jgi:tryptophan 2,3-dioxygenase
MTFREFAQFRGALGRASGAQSDQFRKLEAQSTHMREGFIKLLHSHGLLTASYENDPQPQEKVRNAIRSIYQEPTHDSLCEVAEALYDYDDAFSDFRWQHLKLARRQIGPSRGTAGSAGITYLERTLNQRFFKELVEIRAEVVEPTHSLDFVRYDRR